MKILHIDTGKFWRGGQRQVLILHSGLVKNGVQSILVCNENGKLFETAEKQGAEGLHPLKYKSEAGFSAVRQVQNIIDEHKPDFVHCHDSHAVSIAARLKGGFRIFSTRRVSYPIKLISRLTKYRRVDVHVAVAKTIRDYLAKYFNNTYTIPSCINTDRFKEKRPSPFEKHGDINIVFVGAFSSQKGVEVLISAFADISDDAVLHLVGSGELEESLRKLAAGLNLSERIIFYGARQDVEGFYQNADCVVVPSVDGEGSNGVIKEGMAAGKTVFASDLRENLDLGRDMKNIVFFTNRDSADLASKLNSFISGGISLSEDEILKQAAGFDCSVLIDKYIGLYKKYSSPDMI